MNSIDISISLYNAVVAVCPVDSMQIGTWSDSTTWKFVFSSSATTAQKQAAQNVISTFDPNAPIVRPVLLKASVLLSRLTNAEYTAILQAVQTKLQVGDVQLARWLDQIRTKVQIDLNDPMTTQAETYLINNNLLTAARAAVVFAPP